LARALTVVLSVRSNFAGALAVALSVRSSLVGAMASSGRERASVAAVENRVVPGGSEKGSAMDETRWGAGR
jgi:hypothetical protein